MEQVVATNPQEIKSIVWVMGILVSMVTAGASVSWWMSRQHSQTRKDLYIKINSVERNMSKRLEGNKESCTNNKERVGLLEQSQNHMNQRIEGIDNKLEDMKADITLTKDKISYLAQKQGEQHLAIVGEIRGLGDKIIIDQLKKTQQ